MVMVFLRGALAGLGAGAATGLSIASLLVVPAATSDGGWSAPLLVLPLGGAYGALVGGVLGVAAALMMALSSPLVHSEGGARLLGAAAAPASAFFLAARFFEISDPGFVGLIFLVVCSGIGALVGRFVLFGRREGHR
jgi:hypothetical protein